jgi:hypothetical protein
MRARDLILLIGAAVAAFLLYKLVTKPAAPAAVIKQAPINPLVAAIDALPGLVTAFSGLGGSPSSNTPAIMPSTPVTTEAIDFASID